MIPLMAPHLVHTQGLAGELGCKKRKGKFQSLAESLRRYLDQTVFKGVFFNDETVIGIIVINLPKNIMTKLYPKKS